MRFLSKLLFVVAATAPLASLATVYSFDLEGKGGFGLLPGNENHTVNGAAGSGGELGSGILFDDATNILSVHVGWGSANGFTNLTGKASAAHIHWSGTNMANISLTGDAAFNVNGGVIVGLDNVNFNYSNSASAGLINGSTILTDAHETALFNGQLYINVHTTTNGAGEIRGNLVNATAIPEPSSYAAFAGLGGLALAALRRRRA
jgi:hypothetical protein